MKQDIKKQDVQDKKDNKIVFPYFIHPLHPVHLVPYFFTLVCPLTHPVPLPRDHDP